MISKLYIAPSMQPKTPAPADGKQVSMTAQQVVSTRNSPASLSSPLPENKSFLWDTFAKIPQQVFGAKAEAQTHARTYSNASTWSIASSDAGSTTAGSTRTVESTRPAASPQPARFVSAPASTAAHSAVTSQMPRFNSDSQLLSKTMVLEHSIDHPLHAETQQKIRDAIKQQDFKALDKIANETPVAIQAIETYKKTFKTALTIIDVHPTNTAIEMLTAFYNAKPSTEQAAFIDVVTKAAIAQQLAIARQLSTNL